MLLLSTWFNIDRTSKPLSFLELERRGGGSGGGGFISLPACTSDGFAIRTVASGVGDRVTFSEAPAS